MGQDYQSDEELIARVLRGDPAAHEALFDRYGAVVMIHRGGAHRVVRFGGMRN